MVFVTLYPRKLKTILGCVFFGKAEDKDVENSTVGFFCVLFILYLYYFQLCDWVWIGAPEVKGPAGVRGVRFSQSWGYSGCEPPNVGAVV